MSRKIILRLGETRRKVNRPRKISPSMAKASQISPQMVGKKARITANRVPRCRTMEKKAPLSPERPVKYWKMERCPELDTGRNSVSPWIIPCRIACHTDIRCLLM